MKQKYPIFKKILQQSGEVEEEYKFHPTRKWRFDFAFPDLKIAIEVDGGVWVSGRHNRANGFIKDMEKFNEANILGWNILRYTPEQLNTSKCIDGIKKLIETKSNRHNKTGS